MESNRACGVALALAVLLAGLSTGCGSVGPHVRAPDPEEAKRLVALGDAAYNKEDYEQAIEHYGKAVALDTTDKWSYAQRGESLKRLSRYEEAIADFSKAIELDPSYDWALAHRGETHRMREDYEKALADFDRAIELKPSYDWALASRGECYRLLKKHEDAVKDFTRAVELNPEYGWAFSRRGEAYRMLGKNAEAISDLSKAIALDAKNDFAYASRGQAYVDTGEYVKAIADLNKAIELDPDYAWAKDRRADLYEKIAEQSQGTDKKPAAAGDLPLLTVLDFRIENISTSDGELIVDLLSGALVRTRKFRVLDRGQRETILKEIEFSYSDCVDDKCQLQLGRLLMADKIVLGSLGKVGQRYVVNVRLLDVQTGQVIASSSKVYPSLEQLVDDAEALAKSLAEQ